jgi:hypothetical protein
VTYLLLARKYWKLIGLGLLCLFLAVQTVRLGMAENRIERLKIDNNELRAELKSISDKRNQQKAETEKRVEQAERNESEGRRIADKIRAAPIPQNCETPGLEILRNEI